MRSLIERLEVFSEGQSGFETTMIKDVKSSKGYSLNTGDKVVLSWRVGKDGGQFTEIRAVGREDGGKLLVSTKNLWTYVKGAVKPPSMTTLEKAFELGGLVSTPIGNKTEVDGTDSYGAPAWTLVLGLA